MELKVKANWFGQSARSKLMTRVMCFFVRNGAAVSRSDTRGKSLQCSAFKSNNKVVGLIVLRYLQCNFNLEKFKNKVKLFSDFLALVWTDFWALISSMEWTSGSRDLRVRIPRVDWVGDLFGVGKKQKKKPSGNG